MPNLKNRNVTRIPDVLYHWRTIKGSTAASPSGKDYTHNAGLRAVSDYLAAHHPGAQVVEGPLSNSYRTKRSEERRVGKECRQRLSSPYEKKKKQEQGNTV